MEPGLRILRESGSRVGERLDHRLEREGLDRSDVERVALALAEKHATLPRDRPQGAEAAPDRIVVEIDALFSRFGKDLEQLLSEHEHRALTNRLREFPRRFRDRFVGRWRRGVCAEPRRPIPASAIHLEPDGGVRIADWPDPLLAESGRDLCNELIGIALHLTQARRGDLAEALLATYAHAADDYDFYGVVDFYEALRAFETGLAALEQGDDAALEAGEADRVKHEARQGLLVALATDRTPLVPPQVIAMAGRVACGKSTVAQYIGSEIGAPAVVADRVRASVLEAPLDEDVPEAVWKLGVTPDLFDAVYSELFRRSEIVLASGRPVVIDACFPTAGMRERARELAAKYAAPFLFVECSAPRDVVRERLLARAERDAVDAEVWLDIARGYDEDVEEPSELEADEFMRVDTSISLEENARRLHPRIVAGHRVPPTLRGSSRRA